MRKEKTSQHEADWPVARFHYSSTQVMTAQVPVLSGHDHPAGSGSAGVRRSLQTGVSHCVGTLSVGALRSDRVQLRWFTLRLNS